MLLGYRIIGYTSADRASDITRLQITANLDSSHR